MAQTKQPMGNGLKSFSMHSSDEDSQPAFTALAEKARALLGVPHEPEIR